MGKKISNGESIVLAGISLTPADFVVRKVEKPGYIITEEFDCTVAMPTDIPNELYQEGLIRDVVHHVQGLRRTANFGISDRISIQYETSDDLAGTIILYEDYLRAETLADSIQSQTPDTTYTQSTFKIGGTSLHIGVHRS